MLLPLVFILILLAVLGIVLLLTRPSETDVAVRRGLSKISSATRDLVQADEVILKREWLSPSPGLHDLIAHIPLSWRILTLTKQAASKWWVSSVYLYSFAAAFGVALLGLLLLNSAGLRFLLAAAAGFGPTAYLLILRHQKLKACNTLLPQAVELMGRALRAGLSLNSAIEMAGNEIPAPLGPEFRVVYEEQSLGLPFREAILNLLERLPMSDMRFLTSALLLQRDTGGNLVQILDTVSFVMKERIRIRGQIKIYTAQARMSGWFVGAMPFIMYVLIAFVNPEYSSILLDDPAGRIATVVGIIMWIFGILVIRRIIAIKV